MRNISHLIVGLNRSTRAGPSGKPYLLEVTPRLITEYIASSGVLTRALSKGVQMAPRSILYMAVEGVLVPSATHSCRISDGESCSLKDGEHVERLEDLLAHNEHFGIVLNSSLIIQLGFRAILQLFPSALRGRIVGATIPGNRLIRQCRFGRQTGRLTLLSGDVERRQPEQLAVLEQDARCVPVPLRDRTVIVPKGLWAATRDDWNRLQVLLTHQNFPEQ